MLVVISLDDVNVYLYISIISDNIELSPSPTSELHLEQETVENLIIYTQQHLIFSPRRLNLTNRTAAAETEVMFVCSFFSSVLL